MADNTMRGECRLDRVCSAQGPPGIVRVSEVCRPKSRRSSREGFLLPEPIPGDGLRALKTEGICCLDLYTARCGLLHTGQAPSAHIDSGDARELWYRFDGEALINMMTNTPKPAVLIDVEAGPKLRTEAESQAERCFRTGILIGPR